MFQPGVKFLILFVLLNASTRLLSGQSLTTPILEYRFDGTGPGDLGIAISTGSAPCELRIVDNNQAADLYSEPGAGISGRPPDRALDLRDRGRAISDPVGLGDALHGLKSLTLQYWFKRDFGSVSLKYDNLPYFVDQRGRMLRWAAEHWRETAHWPEDVWSDSREWVFYAVSISSSETDQKGQVSYRANLYRGSETDQVEQVSASVKQAPLPELFRGLSMRDGYFDNLRVFGSKTDNRGALSVDDLEVLRLRDINPGEAPRSAPADQP